MGMRAADISHPLSQAPIAARTSSWSEGPIQINTMRVESWHRVDVV